ncbi:MAG: hypothetical protein LBD05_02305, partial [Mycoplasmataceae bacterium]|nr:hypothetical protein [Mycoplasmataceae bacterium]
MNELRSELVIKNKKNYEKIDKKCIDTKINKKLIKYIVKKVVKNSIICLYNHFSFEPNIDATIEKLLNLKYKICLPCVEKENKLRLIDNVNYKFLYSKSIKQPTSEYDEIFVNEVDLLVVPCLAFRKN